MVNPKVPICRTSLSNVTKRGLNVTLIKLFSPKNSMTGVSDDRVNDLFNISD